MINNSVRLYRKNHPQMIKDIQLRNRLLKYGITIDEYNELFMRQTYCCAICKKHMTEFSRSLHVDHNHNTNTVRGLLCVNCNLMIGHALDNVEILNAGIAYIKQSAQ